MVGAGPSGADLAAGLARAGLSVVLVERWPTPDKAAFSSAALPLTALQQFGLPPQVVAARWSGWQLIGPADQRRCWRHPLPLGAVLDFAALRRWQLDQARAWGVQVHMGCTAVATQPDGASGMVTHLRHGDGRSEQLHSAWVVDASGQSRALLGDPTSPGPDLVAGVGLEWLLQVDQDHWQLWADQLSFFLGSGWVAQGYGWIFPMQPGVLKLGVCRLCEPQGDQPRPQPPLGPVMERLMGHFGLQQARVLDRHGGLIRSSINRSEPHRRGRLLGLGDAISTANLLGGEGIRHALTSSRVLLPLLVAAVTVQRQGGTPHMQTQALHPYQRRLRRALGWRWELSGRLARRTWLGLRNEAADRRLQQLLSALEGAGAEDLSALLFGYRFERYGLKAAPYLLGLR